MSLKVNYYGWDHEAVNNRFTGGLHYCNDFCINGEYHPVTVYKVDTPDRSKGHKDYLLLQADPMGRGGLVRGMNADEMEKWRFQEGLRCNHCNDIIYSVNRHDFHHCKCGKVAIDGGRDYTKVSFEAGSDFTPVRIDLLTDEVKEDK